MFRVHEREDGRAQFGRIVRLLVIVPFREGAHRSDGGGIVFDHSRSPHEGFVVEEVRAEEAGSTTVA